MTLLERIETTETTTTHKVVIQELTRDKLKELTRETEKPIVSIYLDTFTYGEEQLHSGRQLSRTLPHIEKELMDRGFTDEEAALYIKPLLDLSEDEKTWQSMDEGLALFVTAEQAVGFALHNDVDFTWAIDQKPLLEPLTNEMYMEKEFIILSISQDEVRLLEANERNFKRLPLKHLPKKMSDVVPEDQIEKNHLGRSGNGNGTSFHGHDRKEVVELQVERFIKNIAENLKKDLPANDTRPIIVLASPNYINTLKENNTRQHIKKAFIQGSYNKSTDHEIYEIALPVYREELDDTDNIIHDMIDTAESHKLIERSTEAIYDLAKYDVGRIDTLIIKPLVANGSPENQKEITNIDEIMLNVIHGSGTIYAYENSTEFPMTAILRY